MNINSQFNLFVQLFVKICFFLETIPFLKSYLCKSGGLIFFLILGVLYFFEQLMKTSIYAVFIICFVLFCGKRQGDLWRWWRGRRVAEDLC